jgi:hypothetical protein
MSTQIDFMGMGNAELLSELERLVRANRSCCAKLVLHLAEVDARRLYREQAFSCLFEYCVRALRMSESEAYLRIDAARRSRQYPILIELLEAGELNLTSIRLIGPHLTQANHLQVLDRVRGKLKREVERLVAELAPQPDVAASLRRLPERSRKGRSAGSIALATERLALGALPLAAAARVSDSSAAEASVESLAAASVSASPAARASNESLAAASVSASPAAGASVEPAYADLSGTAAIHSAPPSASTPLFALTPSQRAATRALSPGRFKLVLTLDQEQHDKVEQLRELLRHQVPDGDLAAIVNLAISELLEKKRQQRFAQPRACRKRAAPQPRQAPLSDEALQSSDASQPGQALLRDEALQSSDASQPGQALLSDEALQRCDVPQPMASPNSGPRKRDAARSRYVPREVVRAVFVRDEGRCTFVGDNEQRCDARGFLELHHHNVTYARGGEASVENLRLMCRCHNALLAERDYGARYMQRRASGAIAERRARTVSAIGELALL